MRFWTYIPFYLTVEESKEIFDYCMRELPFQQSQIKLFGKPMLIPRKECLIGEVDYEYSGSKLKGIAWPNNLLKLKNKLSEDLQTPFNVCLVNLYLNEHDSNGWHADDERSLGPDPSIASISLGASRKFQIRAKSKGSIIHSINLENGSLLFMKPGMQAAFKHQLPKQTRPIGPRINLTFRYIVQ